MKWPSGESRASRWTNGPVSSGRGLSARHGRQPSRRRSIASSRPTHSPGIQRPSRDQSVGSQMNVRTRGRVASSRVPSAAAIVTRGFRNTPGHVGQPRRIRRPERAAAAERLCKETRTHVPRARSFTQTSPLPVSCVELSDRQNGICLVTRVANRWPTGGDNRVAAPGRCGWDGGQART